MNKLLSALIFAASVIMPGVFAAEKTKEFEKLKFKFDRVLNLTDDNWADMMEENDNMLVFFYQPHM